MILDKIRNRGRDDGDRLAEFFADLNAGHHGPMPADAITPGTLGIGDRIAWNRHGITGGPDALIAHIDRNLLPETRAWFRRSAKPRPYPRSYPQTPDSVDADPHGDQDGSLSPATATESGQATDTPAVAADPTDRRGSVQ